MSSFTLIRRTFNTLRQPVDVTSIVLANPGNTAGVIRLDTNASIVPAGTAMTKPPGSPIGVYQYTITNIVPGVTYRAYYTLTTNSAVVSSYKDFTVPVDWPTPVSPNSSRGVQLRRSVTQDIQHLYLRGHRIKIEAITTEGDVGREVFVFQRMPINPTTGVAEDVFVTVASPIDMADLAVGTPVAPSPFYRHHTVELDVRSLDQLDYVWESIAKAVEVLCLGLDLLDVYVDVEDVWIGKVPD